MRRQSRRLEPFRTLEHQIKLCESFDIRTAKRQATRSHPADDPPAEPPATSNTGQISRPSFGPLRVGSLLVSACSRYLNSPASYFLQKSSGENCAFACQPTPMFVTLFIRRMRSNPLVMFLGVK